MAGAILQAIVHCLFSGLPACCSPYDWRSQAATAALKAVTQMDPPLWAYWARQLSRFGLLL
jgi:hypothetical protein